jgi:hypothetical protein
MIYAFVKNGKIVDYPLGEYDIKMRHSNMSFATPFVPPEGYVLVSSDLEPEFNYTKIVEQGEPEFRDGKCVLTWIVSNAPDDVIANRVAFEWEQIRSRRNAKLKSCDWTQLPDAPLTNLLTADWATYRQALRDITEQDDAFAVVWPTAPEA